MNKLTIYIFLIFTPLFAQKNYFVDKNGNADFKSIKAVNEASLSPGDIVSFKSGQQFSDAILMCKDGITYNSYGGINKAIIGDSINIGFESTINIYKENVTLQNLKIYGYKNAKYAVRYTKGGLTIDNCIISGSVNSHEYKAYGIKCESNLVITRGITIVNNIIRDFRHGIYVINPRNVEIAYNEIYNIYRYDGYQNVGGMGIFAANSIGSTDSFNSNYTFHIHHNNIYNYEHTAMYVGAISGVLVEYNYIHDNLDERLYMGGIKHGGVSKFYDNTHREKGSFGNIFRYNYVHNIRMYGSPDSIYTQGTQSQIKSGTILAKSGGDPNNPTYFTNEKGIYVASKDATISGLGYGNVWIHNNIFNMSTHSVFARGYNKVKSFGEVMEWREDYPSYFVNNTVVNYGNSNQAKNGMIYIESNSQSPTYIYNNILDMAKIDNIMSIYLKEQKSIVDHNIHPKRSKIKKYNDTANGVGYAVFVKDGVSSAKIGSNEKLATDPLWIDTTSNIYAFSVGVNGKTDVYIPDVRILENGNAHNKGMDYDMIGDNYTVLNQRHELGKDPTGRSFAYDILGNFRTTNDIGAVGSASGESSIDRSSNTKAPVIITQPSNKSVVQGETAIITVSATSDGQIGYQWWKSPFVSESESKIVDNDKYSGATTNTLTIKNVSIEDTGVKYQCEVYNTNNRSDLWVNSNSVSIVISQNSSGTNTGNLKVFLEASYSSGKMNSTMSSLSLLPNIQPYQNKPWELNYSDEISQIKSNYVDWLLIELRKEIDQVNYSKSGILTSDGIILNSDESKLSFSNITEGEYYIAIKHRNHLGILSSSKIIVSNGEPLLYDFTKSQSAAYGNNAMTDLGNGFFGMFAGDTDANGVINNLDFGNVANNIPFKGYNNNDLDMNGSVNVLDYNKINKNILKSSYIK